MKRLRNFLRDTRASAATEMALMLPLLLLLMFGGFEAGAYFFAEQKVIKAVREGARYAGRQPFASFPCGGTADATTIAQIQQVTLTGTVTGSAPRVPGMALGDIEVTHRCDASFDSQGIFAGTTGGAPVVLVRARSGYPSLFAGIGLIDDSFTVGAGAEAVVSGI
ncbi:TadE/TadG family type IV pilus assembly protein [Qipengyuania sphaerica]|uniref:TadE/TadG family type IV pilus assembly protein n=1 Tax=Qipengyuania sphaerica TaxID=2867243 RepID=UPI001C8862A7|nr:TadE/TadG family type IV pilus assembly protein [Qipengyuania sphaerica]MBX7541291.1 pilus assembly protein [Qipengyuania sphaerica]